MGQFSLAQCVGKRGYCNPEYAPTRKCCNGLVCQYPHNWRDWRGECSKPPLNCNPNKPSYIGCFVDDFARDLDQGPMRYSYNQKTCNRACKDYRYFALQNNGKCYCGNKYSTTRRYVQKPDSECGGAAAKGGYKRKSIYRTCSAL